MDGSAKGGNSGKQHRKRVPSRITGSLSVLNDAELWVALKQGDKKALELLFYRHYADLYRFSVRFCGNSHLAEDQLQGLFLNIWERREHLGDVSGVKTYLWTALRRMLITHQKEQERIRMAVRSDNESRYEHEEMQIRFSAEEFLIREEEGEEVRRLLYTAINELPARQKEILYLKYFEGFSYDEIEEITSLNYQTIRNYVHESIKILKTILNKPHVDKKPAGSVISLILHPVGWVIWFLLG